MLLTAAGIRKKKRVSVHCYVAVKLRQKVVYEYGKRV